MTRLPLDLGPPTVANLKTGDRLQGAAHVYTVMSLTELEGDRREVELMGPLGERSRHKWDRSMYVSVGEKVEG